jgi:hypothetical protein
MAALIVMRRISVNLAATGFPQCRFGALHIDIPTDGLHKASHIKFLCIQ